MASLCALLTEMTDAYTSFKLSLGRFHNLVWYNSSVSSLVGLGTSFSKFKAEGGVKCFVYASRILGLSNSAANASLITSVSVPRRLRVRSRSHSMMTLTTCSQNVSYALRTVTPRSICAIACAVSNNRFIFECMSMISRP